MKKTKDEQKFNQLHNDDLLQLNWRGDLIQVGCCDCGLVHDIGVGLEPNGKIGIMFERNPKLTKVLRKQRKFRCVKAKQNGKTLGKAGS